MSVRAKIFLISFSLLALASLGGGLYIQSQLSTYLNDDINSNLQNHAKIAQKLFVDAGLNYENADFLADDLGEASGLRVTLVSSSGKVIGDSEISKQDLASVENHSNRPEIIQAVNQGSGLSQRYSNTINTDMRYLAVKIPLESSEGVVRVAAPLSQINQALARVRYTVLGAVLVGFIFAIFVSYFSSNVILGFLKDFINEADISARKDDQEISGNQQYTLETAQKNLKKDLQFLAKQRKQFSSVLEKMGQGVLLLNKSNEVLFYNKTIKEDFWPEIEIGSKFFSNVSYPSFKKFLKKAWDKTDHAVEINGPKSIDSSYLISARRDKSNDEILVVFNDISKLRRLEQMREDFIGNVSHELRTPISVIRANAETLIHGNFVKDPKALVFTEAILSQSENMTDTVSELLKLSSIEAGEFDLNMGRQNLKSFINGILKKHTDQARIKNISFEVEIDENLDVLIDTSAFGIIISNFITNALKHSPANSTVVIKNDLTDDFNSRLSVIDSGRGIPKKYRERVFERFFRVDRGRAKQSGGTGLGLAISKHLARLMGYEIGMKPNKPSGCRFWIEINYLVNEEKVSLNSELNPA
jgi:two-component system phosphate regulon sensor histidine kinase PhoR